MRVVGCHFYVKKISTVATIVASKQPNNTDSNALFSTENECYRPENEFMEIPDRISVDLKNTNNEKLTETLPKNSATSYHSSDWKNDDPCLTMPVAEMVSALNYNFYNAKHDGRMTGTLETSASGLTNDIRPLASRSRVQNYYV